jgi:hypothetical protein
MSYSTYGPKRGCCGHVHADETDAWVCLVRDRKLCDLVGEPSSDRRVVEVDERGLLYDSISEDQWIPCPTQPNCCAQLID